MVSAALFLSLIVFLVLNIPVGIAIGLSSATAIIAGGKLTLGFVAQALVTGCDSFPIMAIPLFILAGELMGEGGVSRRILNVCGTFFGRAYGGLAIVTVTVCMFFAAVSGSGPATVAAVGSMVIPTMLEKGYSKKFTLALIACAGSIGVIIPPSIPMVIYGVSTGTSISNLFLAGFFPGILIGLVLIFYCYVYCKKRGWKGEDKPFELKPALKTLWEGKWALINPVIILGGIYGGVFTPTEAAVGNACSTTGTTMVILGCATAFTKILTIEQIPQLITQSILGISGNPVIILLFINILVIFPLSMSSIRRSISILGAISPARSHHSCSPTSVSGLRQLRISSLLANEHFSKRDMMELPKNLLIAISYSLIPLLSEELLILQLW